MKIYLRKNLLYFFIIISALSFLGNIVKFLDITLIRGFLVIFMVMLFIMGKKYKKYRYLYINIILIILYSIFTVLRSNYDIKTSFLLLGRVNFLLLFVLFIIDFLKNINQAKKIFFFNIYWFSLISLSAFLQSIIGSFSFLYKEENWAWSHGRVGFQRFNSFLGDPNVGGICGGVLILLLIYYKKRSNNIKIFIVICSIILVLYSLSITSVFLLIINSILVLFNYRVLKIKNLHVSVLFLLVVFFIILIIFPTAVKRLNTIPYSFEDQNISYDTILFPAKNYLLFNIDFRIFKYIDKNDTLFKILFGSSYSVVVPSAYFNNNAILSHNSYKEIYISMGVVGLILYLLLFVSGLQKIFYLFKKKVVYNDRNKSFITVLFYIYVSLLFAMIFFPLYHYSGIGHIFWMTFGCIHILYCNRREIQKTE